MQIVPIFDQAISYYSMQTQIRTIKAACNNWEEALTHPETSKLIQTFEKFAINAKKNIRTTNEKETKVA